MQELAGDKMDPGEEGFEEQLESGGTYLVLFSPSFPVGFYY